jgi:RHS repeat-associated protein
VLEETVIQSIVSKVVETEGKEGYRFGFNGQEKMDEIAGVVNHNTALFWEYDTRLGRRWNWDPVVHAGYSGYSVFMNNPLVYIDPLGLDSVNSKDNAKVGDMVCTDDENGNATWAAKGSAISEVTVKAKRTPENNSDSNIGLGKTVMVGGTSSKNFGNFKKIDPSNPILNLYALYNIIQPEAIGISINYSLLGIDGIAGSINLGKIGNDVCVFNTNGIAACTPEIGIGVSVFVSKYVGTDKPTFDSYMGWGKAYNGSFAAGKLIGYPFSINGSYSEGFNSQLERQNPTWKTISIGASIGVKDLSPLPAGGNYQPETFTYPWYIFNLK